MASAFDKCIKIVGDKLGKVLAPKQIEDVLKQVHETHQNNLAKTADKNVARQMTMQTVTGLVDREALALAQSKRLAAFQKLRFTQGRAQALAHADLVRGWRSVYVGVEHYLPDSRNSADSRMNGYYAEFSSFLLDRMKEEGITNVFTSNTQDDHALAAMMDGMGKEGHSPSTQADPNIIKAARVMTDVYAHIRNESLKQGASIGEILGYLGRQLHDPDKMASEGKRAAWASDMFKRLDFDAILHPEKTDPNAPEVTTAKEKVAFLDSAYEAIVSGVRFSSPDRPRPTVSGKGPNIATKMGAERLFIFKSPSDFVNHNKQWGRGTLKALMYESISTTSRQLGLLSKTGPKPEQFHEDMHRAMLLEARNRFADDPQKMRKQIDRINAFANSEGRRQLDTLTGFTNGIDNKLAAYIGGEARAWSTLAKLGSVVISSLNDWVWMAYDNMYMGDSPFKAFTSPLVDFLRISGKSALSVATRSENPELHFVASETGAIAHITNEYMNARVGGNMAGSKGLGGKLAHIQHLISGMTFFDKANRVGMASQLMARMGNYADHSHAELLKENPDFARTLGLYGIKEHEWNLIRKQVETSEVGYRYISGRSLDGIKDEDIAKMMGQNGTDASKASALTLGRAKSDLRLKLFQMIIDRGDHGNFIGRTEERAAMISARRGSGWGEFQRALAMLKTFPLAAYNRGVKRELFGRNVSQQRAIAGLSSMVLVMSAFGVAQRQLKQYLHGQKPDDMKNPKTWVEGIGEGGGFGILTDFLTKEYSEGFGKQGLLDSLAGPVLGDVGRIGNALSELKSSSYDPDQRKRAMIDLANTGKSLIPFQNLWYANQVMNYYLWYQLEEYVHPGSLAKQEEYKRREGQSGPFIPPSSIASPPTFNPSEVTKRLLDYRKANQ